VGADFINFTEGTVDSGAYWVLAGTNTFGSTTTITNSGTLNVAGTLVNAGQISGSGYSLLLSPGAYLKNLNSGTITSSGTGSGSNPVVTGLAGGAATITNLGTIINPDPGVGIYLRAGGRVTNGATNDTTALISSLTPIYTHSGPLTVANFGTIDGPSINSLYGIGIGGGLGGVIVNGAVGSTAALIRGGVYGIRMSGGITTITNFGTILSTVPAFSTGVALAAGGTITDAGTIEGGAAAISFGSGANNLLVLENGYKLIGEVVGAGGSSTNTLELLGTSSANAVTASYNGLSLTNFGTVGFVPGNSNYATLRITNTASLPGTIAGFAGIHDVVDLTQLSDAGNDAVATLDTATNILTVTGDNGTAQLQLDAVDYTGGWSRMTARAAAMSL
jgi:hypothetical protein